MDQYILPDTYRKVNAIILDANLNRNGHCNLFDIPHVAATGQGR